MKKRVNFYLKERAFRWTKHMLIAIVILFAINLPANVCLPMIAAAVVGAQAITAEGKIKKISYLVVSAIVLTFAFPVFSGIVKVLCMLAAYSVLSVKSSKTAAFAAVGVIAITFVFPVFDVIVKIGAILAITAYAGAYEDALAEQRS